MDKFKTTIYLPVGNQNNEFTSETQLVKYIQKSIPREFRVTQIIDTYIDNKYSAVTVEVEEAETTIEIDWLLNYLENRISEVKSSRLKQELLELSNELKKMK